MTATTVSPSLPANAWNSVLKLAIGLTFALVMIAGSFAIGRSTADDSVTVVHKVVAPTTSATLPSLDMPPVGLHSRAATADIPPVATDASCGHTAHTAPC
ncbi:MAG: hypothetical protein ACJ739_02345 [Acidimicrobiales bacterium]